MLDREQARDVGDAAHAEPAQLPREPRLVEEVAGAARAERAAGSS